MRNVNTISGLKRVEGNQLSQLPFNQQRMELLAGKAMKIDHPNAEPLSEEQLLVLKAFRERLDSMVSSHGLTPENVQEMVRELKAHPLISVQMMQEIREEVGRLLPGQRFTFDWE